MKIYKKIRGYKAKREPRRRNPDDPVWQGILRMRGTRIEARESIQTGKPYRDPYADRFTTKGRG
jgi:hypothetical protein